LGSLPTKPEQYYESMSFNKHELMQERYAKTGTYHK
jgi:hypothetical protein